MATRRKWIDSLADGAAPGGARPDRAPELSRPGHIATGPAGQARPITFTLPFLKPVKTLELCTLTGQLALMLETGTPLAESLKALVDQTRNAFLHRALERVYQEVSAGSSLGDALEKHPRIFDSFYVATVRVGEATGSLATVFQRLEGHMEKKEAILATLRVALTYPVILACLAFGAVLFLLTFVLPKFVMIFASSGVVLPLPTRMLMGAAEFSRAYWYLILLGMVLVVSGVWFVTTSQRAKPFFDRFVLRIPLVGGLVSTVQTSVLLRMIGTLLRAGVSLMETLEVSRKACSSTPFRQLVDSVVANVTRGEGLSGKFAESNLLPPMVKQMIVTGERTGSLPAVMNKMADYLDAKTERRIKALSAMFEPFVIIVMGVVVGFIALAILLPLFRLATAVKGS